MKPAQLMALLMKLPPDTTVMVGTAYSWSPEPVAGLESGDPGEVYLVNATDYDPKRDPTKQTAADLVARAAGQALNEAYPWGYRSDEDKP